MAPCSWRPSESASCKCATITLTQTAITQFWFQPLEGHPVQRSHDSSHPGRPDDPRPRRQSRQDHPHSNHCAASSSRADVDRKRVNASGGSRLSPSESDRFRGWILRMMPSATRSRSLVGNRIDPYPTARRAGKLNHLRRRIPAQQILSASPHPTRARTPQSARTTFHRISIHAPARQTPPPSPSPRQRDRPRLPSLRPTRGR